ncbi:hypothetical protein COCC4DRAFT_43770 [Bipolaris maydis ATCC 48331]|uniref:Uncharacterized protein n=2 Tax=Cochliobolus heterostrophus TaxID=5016 RepID=M2TA72_COCH5|nr:uncharacterized protein COCC4DRAFT_43770 [Bipolaris maydis ATCC 48331]EMD94450.1 hypothetical protein COCHEDRAFT_1211853 [Bipolaris maydis C5]KAH7563783.1 hypothetical protein BM1_00830 [Bipolaris maydis]ENI01209.1 hypothetical protein COCC4DRAFT_43770 [Bipolaris maydis ATCC 48331]KAJ5026407.1 hypothetical protein J3E73DRAFT_369443 [Bipolaris maydis]KAJ5059871.1 hypothetical protein J3E74DRAFT_291507 [Bipolaris maydis]
MADSYSMTSKWPMTLVETSVSVIHLFLMLLIFICVVIVIAFVLFMALVVAHNVLVTIPRNKKRQEDRLMQDLDFADMPPLVTTDTLPSASTSSTSNPKRSRKQFGKRPKNEY